MWHLSVLSSNCFWCIRQDYLETWNLILGLNPILVSYNNWCLYNSIASNKAFIRLWLWVQTWFRGRSIITTSPERPSSISRHYQIDVALWDCQIHADAVGALSWIFSMYFLLSDVVSFVFLWCLYFHAYVQLIFSSQHPKNKDGLFFQIYFIFS